MPENTISVKVTADVTDAKTNLAVGVASLRQFNSAVTASAKVAATASEENRAAAMAQLQVAVEAAERQTAVVNSLKATVAAASAEIAGSNERVQTSFGKLHESVRIAGESIEGLSAKLSVYEGLASSVGELVAVGFGVEAIAEQVNKVAELGESYAQLSEKTGATIQQLGGLRLAAMETNTDFDTVGNGLRELGMKMQEAIAQPSSQAAEAFQRAGISIQDSAGNMLPVLDVFTQITAKMATYQDGAAKTALAGDMLGAKFGSTLIPMMNQVGDQFAELEAKAQALGLTMSTETVEASEKFIESQKDAGAAATGLRTEIVGGSLPAFAALEQEFIISAQSGGVLSDAAQVLDVGLRVVTEAALLTVTAVTDVADAATYVGNVFGDVALAADGLAFALEGKFALASAAVKVATTDIGTSWSNMLEKMDAQGKLFATTTSQLLGNVATLDAQPAKIAAPGLSGAVSMGDRQGVAGQDNSNAGGNTYDYSSGGAGDGGVSKAQSAQEQMTQIAQAAAEARKQISDSEYQAQVSNWDAEVAQGQMTKAQEIQAEISAQNEMYKAALAEETKEAALDAAGTAEKAKALDDIAVLTASHNAEIASLNSQLVSQQMDDAKKLQEQQEAAAEATQQAWQKAFQPITQAFDASVNGVLQGTQTLQQAEVKAAQSIALAFIDAEAKKLEAFLVDEAMILARHIAVEAGLTSATVAGTAARLAAQTTGDATGKAADIAMTTGTITRAAGSAAAGAMAAVSGIPFVGPALAAVAGPATYAAVMAYDVLSASAGLALGPGENPLVQLHENETVLPAHIAQPLQSWLSNSSTDNSSQSNFEFNQHIHGGGAGVDSAMMAKAGNAMMSSIIDLTRNGTLRLPGRG